MGVKHTSRKVFQALMALVLLLNIISCGSPSYTKQLESTSNNTTKIGIIYSESGEKAISEKSMRDVAAMAVEEINNNGGLLNKQIELIALDSESKDNLYKGYIVQLLNKYKVKAIFSYIPAKTKSHIKALSTKSGALIFDLSDYVNTEQDNKLIQLGSAPNQLLYPGVDYLLKSGKDKFTNFFIAGTTDFHSKNSVNALKAYLLKKGVPSKNIKVGQLETGTEDATKLILNIKRFTTQGKTCVLNTMTGKANLVFFKEFANQGLSSFGCPIMSFNISEDEMRFMGAEFNIGHYFCRNYFQSFETDKNIRFVSDFKLYCAINELPGGIDRVTGETIARTYTGIHLWKKAIEKANSFEKEKVRKALINFPFNSPLGVVQMSNKSTTLDKPVAIAESNFEGQMTILWQSKGLIKAQNRN